MPDRVGVTALHPPPAPMRLALLAGLLFAATSARAQYAWISASGHVVDAATGAPVAGAEAILLVCDALDRPETCRPIQGRDEGGPQRPLTDAAGAFYIGATAEAVYAVRVERSGYCSAALPPYDERALMQMRIRLRDYMEALAPAEDGSNAWAMAEAAVPRPHYQIALSRLPCTVE